MENRIKESISLKYYQKNDNVKARYLNMVKAWASKQPVKSLIRKMNEQVKKYLAKYEEDFYVHDIQSIISSGADRKMLWIVREKGTHLVDLNSLRFSSKGTWVSRFQLDAIVGMKGKRVYYYIDNEELHTIEEEKCYDYLYEYEKANRAKVKNGEKEEDRLLDNKKYHEEFDYRGRAIKRQKKSKKSSIVNQKIIPTKSNQVAEIKNNSFVYEVNEEGQLVWVG